MPSISICIANYNGEDLLEDCIGSVLAQVDSPDFEIIVHDDASTDQSVTLLRERYPQIQLICSDVNVGFCVSNNRMVEMARGEYILLLNNDASLHPDALDKLSAAALHYPGIMTLPQYDFLSGKLVDRGSQLDLFYTPVPNRDEQQRDVAYVIGACLWIPRQLWQELGGFPDWIESIAEDLILCCLARLRGYPVVALPVSGYRHHQGKSFGGNRVDGDRLSTTFRRRFLSERNRSYALVICTPTIAVWPLLFVHAAVMIVEGSALSLLKFDRRFLTQIYLPALGGLVARFGTLLTLRRKTQSHRQITAKEYWSRFVWTPRKLQALWRHGLPSLK